MIGRGKYPLCKPDINLRAIHHAITDAIKHNKSYLEWNGEITEEMYVYITDRNLKLINTGYNCYTILL